MPDRLPARSYPPAAQGGTAPGEAIARDEERGALGQARAPLVSFDPPVERIDRRSSSELLTRRDVEAVVDPPVKARESRLFDLCSQLPAIGWEGGGEDPQVCAGDARMDQCWNLDS